MARLSIEQYKSRALTDATLKSRGTELHAPTIKRNSGLIPLSVQSEIKYMMRKQATQELEKPTTNPLKATSRPATHTTIGSFETSFSSWVNIKKDGTKEVYINTRANPERTNRVLESLHP